MTQRYSRRQAIRLGAGIAGAAVLAACGSPGPGLTGTPTTAATREVQVRGRGAENAPPATGGLLRLGVVRSSEDAIGLERIVTQLVYSRLVSVDPRTSSVYSDLVSSIEIPEPLTVRLRIVRGARFHADGRQVAATLDAGAVTRDFERRQAEGAYLFSDVLAGFEARGSDLVLKLRAPFSLLFEMLGRPEYSIRGQGRYSGSTELVGSGPFVPAGSDATDQAFVANPLLAGPQAPRLAQVIVHGASDDQELDTRFAGGLSDVRVHPDAASRQTAAARTARVEVQRPAQRLRGLAVSMIGTDAASSAVAAFQDERVRRAISLSLDRRSVAALDGSLLSGPVGPAFAGDALPDLELETNPLLEHDPAGARQLLAAAGAEGLMLRLVHASTSSMLTLAQAVADELGTAGIVPRLQTLAPAAFETAFLRGQFESALFELQGLDTPDLGLRLHTTAGLDGHGSPWGYSNPPYDAAVRAALSELDPESRARRSRDAQRTLYEDVPAMFPLSCPMEYASLAPGLTGYEFGAYDHNPGFLANGWSMPLA